MTKKELGMLLVAPHKDKDQGSKYFWLRKTLEAFQFVHKKRDGKSNLGLGQFCFDILHVDTTFTKVKSARHVDKTKKIAFGQVSLIFKASRRALYKYNGSSPGEQ